MATAVARRAHPRSTTARKRPTPDDRELTTRIGAILGRHPAVGLAVGVVRDGRLAFFHGHGLADVASATPITEDTVFRIASVTKLFTAIAVLQLVERGLVRLDAPVEDALRAYRLIPADPGLGPPTVRQLLTHTGGIPDVVRTADLLHPGWGSFDARPGAHSVAVGARIPTLAEVYRPGLRYVIRPGTAFAYTSHGFATLGQVVEDVSGMPLDQYLRERIFEPLGMVDTDLLRPARLAARLARGYELGSRGPRAVTDREWVTAGASSVLSTTRDLARFVAALAAGGTNDTGSILEPATLASMFDPHWQPDPRVPGMGLGFFRSDLGGHRVVGHDGRLPGFNAQVLVAPDDGLGVIGLTNGSRGAMSWLPIELDRLLRHLLGVSEDRVRDDLPHRPEVWESLCGRYQLPPRVSDLRGRMMTGGGIEVLIRDGRPVARLRVPLPALLAGIPLHPDDAADPFLYRIDLARFGLPTVRLAFGRDPSSGGRAIHTDLACLSLVEQPMATGRRTWLRRAAVGIIVAGAGMALRQRRRT